MMSALLRTAATAAVLVGTAVGPLAAEPIFKKQPFDRITLRPSAGGETVEVETLKLPGRRVPDPFPRGSLSATLIDDRSNELSVSWSDIARIELFEQIILTEGMKRVDAGEFDEAYDYLARLHRDYPAMPGLDAATARYLQQNAFAAFRDEEYDRALAMLASLFERQPGAAGLATAVDKVADEVIQGHLKARDLRSARSVLDVVEKQFGALELTVVDRWRGQFRRAADDRVAAGARFFRDKKFREARSAALDARSIWPEHQRAAQLLTLVQRENPTIIVGVRTASPQPLHPRVDSPASLRTAFLAAQTLTRITDYSPEGGIYASPIGAIGLDAAGRELSMTVLDYPSESPAALDAAASVARWLLRAADPSDADHEPSIAAMLGGVVTPEPDVLAMGLARPHVRPEALLHDVMLEQCGLPAPYGAFGAEPVEEGVLQLDARRPGGAVASLEERRITSDDAAVAAITQGDIDILARVAPSQIATLRSSRDVVVAEYRLPTIHVLIPTTRHKLLDQREFRRALAYGIRRQQILKQTILGGSQLPGFQLVSGPFPAGKSLNDYVRYGYNDGVRPRPYEPRLAALLAALAWTNVQKAENGKDDPADDPFPTLRLAHSSDPVARMACQDIRMHLKPLGIPIKLVELPEEQLLDPEGDFELRYAELAAWEPVVDAQRVLGPDGVAGRCSDPMFAALSRLDGARNWDEALQTLRDVHELAAGDLPVIPLWQTGNYYAFRRDLAGLPASTIHLYQSLGDWRKESASSR